MSAENYDMKLSLLPNLSNNSKGLAKFISVFGHNLNDKAPHIFSECTNYGLTFICEYLLTTYEAELKKSNLLFYAIKNDNFLLCSLLINHGAFLNYTKNNPLSVAIMRGADINIVKLLLTSGAELAVNNYQAVKEAVRSKSYGLCELFPYDHGASVAGLNEAILEGNIALMKLFINKGANLEDIDETCFTLKHKDKVNECIYFLLSKGMKLTSSKVPFKWILLYLKMDLNTLPVNFISTQKCSDQFKVFTLKHMM